MPTTSVRDSGIAKASGTCIPAAGSSPSRKPGLRPIQLAKSGPAGGALAASAVARHLGYDHAVTMDVGGTSTDICIMLDGEIQQREIVELEHGIPARIRSLDIHAIGAGGGSIVSLDAGGAVSVGPRSAGAVPGPACYGRGGPAAVTDANLVLGILPEKGLLDGGVPLDRDASVRALEEVARPLGRSVEALGRGGVGHRERQHRAGDTRDHGPAGNGHP